MSNPGEKALKKVRYGIVGTGFIGMQHADSLLSGRIPDASLTALCRFSDIPASFVEHKAKENGINVYMNYEDMLNSGDIDAVIVATPHYCHPGMAETALKKNINVISEKPGGVFTKSLLRLNKTAAESDAAFGIMFNMRTDPYFAKMREIVRSGELGEIQRVVWINTDWYRTQAYYNGGAWRGTWDGEGGGVLLNQCPHNLDIWQWVCGMPKRVRAFCRFGRHHKIEVEDEATIYAEYENGASAVFIASTGEAPGTNRFEVAGDNGKLVYENGTLTHYILEKSTSDVTANSNIGFDKIPYTVKKYDNLGKGEQHVGILKNFTSHLLRGEELLAPGTDGIKELSISNAAYLSSYKNDWVEVDNDGEEFLSYLNSLRSYPVV